MRLPSIRRGIVAVAACLFGVVSISSLALASPASATTPWRFVLCSYGNYNSDIQVSYADGSGTLTTVYAAAGKCADAEVLRVSDSGLIVKIRGYRKDGSRFNVGSRKFSGEVGIDVYTKGTTSSPAYEAYS
jgi:hypothetical protein